MKRLNDALLERKVDSHYVTLILLLWNRRTGEITMANAGAIPPLICRGDEKIKVRIEGIPLGLLENREYDEVTFQSSPGDLLLLYSDGIPDQVNPADEEYGLNRLTKVVKKHCADAVKSVVEAVYSDLDRFMDGGPMTDDQTMVAVRVGEPAL
jgi:phosphoserine phosphatase RsbU/P